MNTNYNFLKVFHIAKDDLKLLILLSLDPKCWTHRCTPAQLAYAVLGLHACKASILSTELYPQTTPSSERCLLP